MANTLGGNDIKSNRVVKISIISVLLLMFIGGTIVRMSNAAAPKEALMGKSYKSAVLNESEQKKVVATINGDNIYQSEINYLEWQYDNAAKNMRPFDASKNKTTDLMKIIAKRKLVLSEAKKTNVVLSKDEMDTIKHNALDSFNNDPAGNKAFLDNAGLSPEAMQKILVDDQMDVLIESNFISTQVVPLMVQNKFQTNDS